MEEDLLQSSFNYRIGSAQDFAQLKQLTISAYGQFQGVLTPENWQKLRDGLQNNEQLKELIHKSQVFICEVEDQIIGMAYFVPSGNPDKIFQEDWCYIKRVGVDPLYRGQGIAARLIELCIQCAREKNEKVLMLHTSEFMDSARHIYESLGFQRMREIDPMFGKRYWLYSMDLR